MTDQVALLLDRYTPPADDALSSWGDVVARAGRGRARALRRRAGFAFAIAAAAAVVAVATPVGDAIGRGVGDFSAWLTGLPGKPAPASDVRALDRATRTWLAFPRGTKLHRLLETEVGGTNVVLDGYRVGSSFCLQVVATGAAKGSEQSCAPLADLKARKAPALAVLVDDGFGIVPRKAVQIGPDEYTHGVRVDVTIGLVADGVDRVETDGGDALVGSNAFLSVVSRPPIGYRTRHVWATVGGKRVAIPFARAPFGDLQQTLTPAGHIPGPSKVQRVVRGGDIAWVERREPRGAPVPPSLRRHRAGFVKAVLFERLIAPDPNSPLRDLVSIDRISTPFHAGQEVMCIGVVTGGGSGEGCGPIKGFFAHGPLSVGESVEEGGDEYEVVDGVVSDDVRRVELFLGNGARIAVPLKDNVFVVQADRAGLPGRMVAYDAEGRVIAVQKVEDAVGEAGGPRTARGAKYRTALRVTSPSGMTARMLVAAKQGGGTCWVFREANGAGGGGCPPKRWRGPALQVSYSELDTDDPRPAFVWGAVRPGIASLEIRLHDGRTVHAKVVGGLVIAVLPKGYRASADALAIGLDAHGKPVAEHRLRAS